MTDATDTQLAAQYEAFPYPQRDPREEAKRLVVGSPGHLHEVDYWVFGALRPKARPLRALIAGGGTGDATIMLATQLIRAGRPGSVTYLDRSAAAMAIAQARATARGLTNIVWRQGSLLELTDAEQYDYIDCCGVLHHLPDPEAGLACLMSALAPDGGMGLMVYAPHGRTGVYMLQDVLRRLAPPDLPPAIRLDIARRVMRNLPESAWLRANRSFSDHIDGGDAGLYDLLLNPRDRAYDIPAFHTLIASAGLRITALMEPTRYDPAAYLPDARLRAKLAQLDPIGRASLAESLCGNIATHVAYCVSASQPLVIADPLDPGAIPIAREKPAEELLKAIRPDGSLNFLFDGLRVPVALPKLAIPILKLIDGHRSLRGIAAEMTKSGVSDEAFMRAWRETWDKLSSLNQILLAAPA